MNLWYYALLAILFGGLGASLVVWLQAELDERRWRKRMERDVERVLADLRVSWDEDDVWSEGE